MCQLERHLGWNDTSKVCQIKECLPLASHQGTCSESSRGFFEQQALWRIKQEGDFWTPNQNKVYSSSRKIIFSLPHQNTYHHFIAYVYEAKIETLRCTTTVHLENETGFWGCKSETMSSSRMDHYYIWKLFKPVQLQQSLIKRSKKPDMLYK